MKLKTNHIRQPAPKCGCRAPGLPLFDCSLTRQTMLEIKRSILRKLLRRFRNRRPAFNESDPAIFLPGGVGNAS